MVSLLTPAEQRSLQHSELALQDCRIGLQGGSLEGTAIATATKTATSTRVDLRNCIGVVREFVGEGGLTNTFIARIHQSSIQRSYLSYSVILRSKHAIRRRVLVLTPRFVSDSVWRLLQSLTHVCSSLPRSNYLLIMWHSPRTIIPALSVSLVYYHAKVCSDLHPNFSLLTYSFQWTHFCDL